MKMRRSRLKQRATKVRMGMGMGMGFGGRREVLVPESHPARKGGLQSMRIPPRKQVRKMIECIALQCEA